MNPATPLITQTLGFILRIFFIWLYEDKFSTFCVASTAKVAGGAQFKSAQLC